MLRTLNSKAYNKIANDSQVRPFLGGKGELDLTNIVSNTSNFCFMTNCQKGAHLLLNKGNGFYETHTLSLPEARGRAMYKLMQDARAFMFLNTDCVELSTFVPDGQKATFLWAIKSGFRELFKHNDCFNFNGNQVGGSFFSQTYEDWVLKDKKNLVVGQVFHEGLHKLDLASHKEDAVHEAWAGATVRGCFAGTALKVVSYYNKWACRTGYLPARIVSLVPLVIDIGEAVLQLNAGQLSVLKVKDECLSEPQLVVAFPLLEP